LDDRSTLSHALWTADPATQTAILLLLATAFVLAMLVYAPLLLRLFRTSLLDRSLKTICLLEHRPKDEQREEFGRAFSGTPAEPHYSDFIQRWNRARELEQDPRSPVRLSDIFDERPLLPAGARRSLVPALPGLFLGLGILWTFVGLTDAVSSGAIGGDPAEAAAAAGQLAEQLGLALRTSIWGMLLALFAAVAGRLIEGMAEGYEESLDRWVEHAFGSISAAELATLTAHAQRASLQELGGELTRFTNDLTERMDRGLQRIERSTASAAGLVSEEQRGALSSVVRELSLQIQQGVESHLTRLHTLLEQASTHQEAVTGGLASTASQMDETARTHARVTQALEHAASSVDDAAQSFSSTAQDMSPVLEHLRQTGSSLQHTSASIESTQHTLSGTADGVRHSLEHAASAMNEQRDFIELGLREIRGTLDALSSGLGENLSHALRGVDDALSHTVGRLRETIEESNETIDRMTVPVQAAEGTTRELHTALERVRGEIVGLGEWLGQSLKPVRHTLVQIEDRAGDVARSLNAFGDRAQSVDKTMDALRGEIHEEGRRVRQSSSELGRHLSRTTDSLQAIERIQTSGSETSAHAASSPALPSQSTPSAPASTPVPVEAPTPVPTPPDRPRSKRKSKAKSKAKAKPDEDLAVERPPALGPAIDLDFDDSPPEPLDLGPTLPSGGPAGRSLGPDPYARLDAERRSQSASSMSGDLSEVDPTQSSDDLTLSGLLRTRAPEETTSGSEARGSDEADEATEPDEQDDGQARETPRTWRLIGRE
jgi:ABC-type transporter Mla subunit MlaD